MSSYGATAVWSPAISIRRASLRLTRRGRLLRFGLLVLLLVALGVLGPGRLAGQPARANVEPIAEPVATARVVVQQGDSLWNIAQRQAPQRDPRDTIHEIRELNGLRSNLIQPGQVLLVPTP